MGYIFSIITIALHILYIGLLLRMLLDWVRVFVPGWRPRGIALLCASGVYALTDWPMNQLRKVVPPLRIGNFALDTGFLILILGVGLLLSVMTSLTLTFSR